MYMTSQHQRIELVGWVCKVCSVIYCWLNGWVVNHVYRSMVGYSNKLL